jgi:peptidyl-prolyl cis-trans isomerase C
MSRLRIGVVALLALFALIGCDKIPFLQKGTKPKKVTKTSLAPGAKMVAVIGNFYLTNKDLNKEVESYNSLVDAQGMTQSKLDTKEKKIAYLRNEIVRKYMLYQEALDRGLDKNEDIASDIEYAKMGLLVSELVRQELNKIEVTSKEIEDFYNKNKNELVEPEQRKILEIVTPTEDEAKQVYIELLKGTDFASLAKQYSKGPSASQGGDLGFVSLELDPKKRIRFDKFYEIAFTLESGAVSNIFKSPEGTFYIVKIDTLKKPEPKSLSELWDNIKSWLLFEKQNKEIKELADRLAGETKVEIYEEKVE